MTLSHRLVIGASVILSGVLSAWTFQQAQDPPAAGERPLEDRQEEFLKEVQAGRVEKAYADLLKNSPLARDKAEDIRLLMERTDQAIKFMKGSTAIDNYKMSFRDRYLAMGMGVVCTERQPLFFYFAWYRKTESSPWVIQAVNFNDDWKEFASRRR